MNSVEVKLRIIEANQNKHKAFGMLKNIDFMIEIDDSGPVYEIWINELPTDLRVSGN